jgi:pantetheine-phosphate adenylyltransferase
MFTVPERVEMLQEATHAISNVSVDTFSGLLVDYVRQNQAKVILRGIRAFTDYEYELQMALMNRKLAPDLETVFLMPALAYTYVSSRLVREIFHHGGSVTGLVPALVEERLHQKFFQGKTQK